MLKAILLIGLPVIVLIVVFLLAKNEGNDAATIIKRLTFAAVPLLCGVAGYIFLDLNPIITIVEVVTILCAITVISAMIK